MTTPANPLRSGPAPATAKLSINGNNPTTLINLGDASLGVAWLIIVKARETTFLAQQDFKSFLILAQGFANSEAARSVAATVVDTAASGGAAAWTAVAELSGNDVVITVTGAGGIDIEWTAKITEV